MTKSRAAVAFYAPWCGPCQQELPVLSRTLGKSAELLIVIAKDEDVEHTKRQLANIGLRDVRLYVDITGALAKEGRVTALPTTFAVSKRGAVLARTKGYSFGSMYQLAKKVDREAGAGLDDGADEAHE
jgi:thiol-disulfide isomerase/thioredoxin